MEEATINLVALIEEEFQIQTEPEELARLVSFHSILDYVNETVSLSGRFEWLVMGRRGQLSGAICTRMWFPMSVSGHVCVRPPPSSDSLKVCVATHPIHA